MVQAFKSPPSHQLSNRNNYKEGEKRFRWTACIERKRRGEERVKSDCAPPNRLPRTHCASRIEEGEKRFRRNYRPGLVRRPAGHAALSISINIFFFPTLDIVTFSSPLMSRFFSKSMGIRKTTPLALRESFL